MDNATLNNKGISSLYLQGCQDAILRHQQFLDGWCWPSDHTQVKVLYAMYLQGPSIATVFQTQLDNAHCTRFALCKSTQSKNPSRVRLHDV